jgi:beta-N-acetylhexosaminidase
VQLEGGGPSAGLASAQDAPAVAGAAVVEPTAAPTAEPPCQPAPLAERAAAVLVMGLPGVTAADEPLAEELTQLGVGGVLITKTNVVDAEQIAALIEGLRAGSATPLLVTTDEEPGRVSSFGAVLGRSSSARTLATRSTPLEVRTLMAELGAELSALGIDVALAPVADLDDGPAQGVIGDRSSSANPEIATRYVRAQADGLRQGGVMSAVKHFPGHGRSRVDSHASLADVDAGLDELLETDLVPFVDQIERDVPIVMLAHVAFPALGDDLPASLSPAAYELLRDLGFRGVAMTDSLGMGAIHQRWDFPESAVLALAAGADALLATDGNHARRMRDAIVDAVRAGDIPEERLDEAAARMRLLAGGDPHALACRTAEDLGGPPA